MAAARFLARQRVAAHELAQLEEVGDAAGHLERLVQLLAAAEHRDVLPELLAQRRDLPQGPLQTRRVPRHAALVPHDPAELTVERHHGAPAADTEQPPRALR